MNENFTFELWETIDYLNIIKSEIKEHLENNAIAEAGNSYQKLWVIADLGIYAIPDIKGKKEFLHLVQSVANEVRDEVRFELRKQQSNNFYSLEDEVHKRMIQTEDEVHKRMIQTEDAVHLDEEEGDIREIKIIVEGRKR